jgi:hypothetical protein
MPKSPGSLRKGEQVVMRQEKMQISKARDEVSTPRGALHDIRIAKEAVSQAFGQETSRLSHKTRDEVDSRDDPSQGHENSTQAAVAERFPAVKPAGSDDEACLGVADDGAAHWAGFVDDQELREVDETG